ncbi:hypothetical protein [Shouchella lonarensis]|nr:hypothetical protein [Shouchella lonarensis]
MKRWFCAFILTLCLTGAIVVQSAATVEPLNGPSRPVVISLPNAQ